MLSVPEVSAGVRRDEQIKMFSIFLHFFFDSFSLPLIEFIVFMCQRHMWFIWKTNSQTYTTYARLKGKKLYAAYTHTNEATRHLLSETADWEMKFIFPEKHILLRQKEAKSKIKYEIIECIFHFSWKHLSNWTRRQDKITKATRNQKELWRFIYILLMAWYAINFSAKKGCVQTTLLKVQTNYRITMGSRSSALELSLKRFFPWCLYYC